MDQEADENENENGGSSLPFLPHPQTFLRPTSSWDWCWASRAPKGWPWVPAVAKRPPVWKLICWHSFGLEPFPCCRSIHCNSVKHASFLSAYITYTTFTYVTEKHHQKHWNRWLNKKMLTKHCQLFSAHPPPARYSDHAILGKPLMEKCGLTRATSRSEHTHLSRHPGCLFCTFVQCISDD